MTEQDSTNNPDIDAEPTFEAAVDAEQMFDRENDFASESINPTGGDAGFGIESRSLGERSSALEERQPFIVDL